MQVLIRKSDNSFFFVHNFNLSFSNYDGYLKSDRLYGIIGLLSQ